MLVSHLGDPSVCPSVVCGGCHMLDLTAWLRLVGLEGGNPFANKQADEEREWLQACFVEHPAFNALAREKPPHSSILHAARGSGKTSACTMYEQLCMEEAAYRQVLVVRFSDWLPLTGYLHQPFDMQVNGYLSVLFRQVANSLGHAHSYPWLHPPADHALQAFLAWFCETYGDELTDHDLSQLAASARLFIPGAGPHVSIHNRYQPIQSQFKLLLRALKAAGVQQLIVLVDRVDEVAISVADAAQGANLLLPLIGNLDLLEREGLVFKFFVPTEVVAVLRQRRQLRDDRVRCDHLEWADTPQGQFLLIRVLQNRLRHFSAGRIDSLAALADPDLRASIDEQIAHAANGSPRTLLLLGEALLLARAADADSGNLLIGRVHLEHVLSAQIAIPQLTQPLASPEIAQATRPKPSMLPVAPSPFPPVQGAPPRIQMQRDGTVSCGHESIPNTTQLPRLQRLTLRYLFSKVGSLCSYSELGREVWNDELIDEDTVRKVLTRLMGVLNAGVDQLPYLERRSGGFYLLQHAELLPLEDEPAWSTLKPAQR